MSTEPRSTRQPLEWMPLELIPDDSERGYRTIQHNPAIDPNTGGWSVTMFGHTPRPTVTNGYRTVATVEFDPTYGAAVTRLVIEPSLTIQQDDDSHRRRTDEESRLSPINSTVLARIRFTDLLNRIAEIEIGYADFVDPSLPEASAAAAERVAGIPKRGPQKNLATHAKWAEQVLDSMAAGRGYQARLRDLYPFHWSIGREGIRKRVSRLRKDGWLHTDRGRAGTRLVEWRREHGPDHWIEEEA